MPALKWRLMPHSVLEQLGNQSYHERWWLAVQVKQVASKGRAVKQESYPNVVAVVDSAGP